MPNRRAVEQVAFLARAHERGIICSTESWMQIAAALTPATATDILDGLSLETREPLLSMYLDRPPLADVRECMAQPTNSDFRAVGVLIVNCCESKTPTELRRNRSGLSAFGLQMAPLSSAEDGGTRG